jgi:two-component system catabolic regulation response regulator CreB
MPNILLVEDDKIIAESIIFSLENDSFKVVWCEMGNDAIKTLDKSKFDLVLLDIGLPDISGFDVLRKLRKTSEMPVIIITARDADEDIVLGLEGLGADDYVTKPFNNRVLIARIRAQLRHVKVQSSASTEAQETSSKQIFEINKDLHQILFHGEVVGLTRAECKILMHLVEKPNRIHSKEHLLNVMHDRPTGAGENTIVTHIRHIRMALNKINLDNEHIKNHKGLGYSLTL